MGNASKTGNKGKTVSNGVSTLMKKKRKQRRDHTELRTKSHTKHNKMWKSLNVPMSQEMSSALKTQIQQEKAQKLIELANDKKNSAEAVLKREQRKEKLRMGESNENNENDVSGKSEEKEEKEKEKERRK